MRDLIKPERARVLRILSALINLQKFKVEKLIWYQNLEMEKVCIHSIFSIPVIGCSRSIARSGATYSSCHGYERKINCYSQRYSVGNVRPSNCPHIARNNLYAYEYCRLNRQNEQAIIDGVTEDCKKLEAARDELYARIAAKEKENEALKASILGTFAHFTTWLLSLFSGALPTNLLFCPGLREEKAALDHQVLQKREEIELTRAFVVDAPEELMEQEKGAEKQLREETSTLRDIENNNKLLDRQIEVVAKANKDVSKAIQLLEAVEVSHYSFPFLHNRILFCTSVQVEASKLKRIIREEKSKREVLDAINLEEKALTSNLDLVLAQKKRAEEKLSEIRKSLEGKIDEQNKALEQIRKEIEDFTNMTREATDARSTSESEYMRLQRKKDALVATHTAEVAEIIESLKRLHSSVEGYHNALYRGMASISSDSRDFLAFSKSNETSWGNAYLSKWG